MIIKVELILFLKEKSVQNGGQVNFKIVKINSSR